MNQQRIALQTKECSRLLECALAIVGDELVRLLLGVVHVVSSLQRGVGRRLVRLGYFADAGPTLRPIQSWWLMASTLLTIQ